MRTGEVCNRTAIVVGRDTSPGEAAKLMRGNHVGNEQSRETSQRR